MTKIGKPSEPPQIVDKKTADDKAKKPPPPRGIEVDEYEDGDIATPKRDRYGPDDEPL